VRHLGREGLLGPFPHQVGEDCVVLVSLRRRHQNDTVCWSSPARGPRPRCRGRNPALAAIAARSL